MPPNECIGYGVLTTAEWLQNDGRYMLQALQNDIKSIERPVLHMLLVDLPYCAIAMRQVNLSRVIFRGFLLLV